MAVRPEQGLDWHAAARLPLLQGAAQSRGQKPPWEKTPRALPTNATLSPPAVCMAHRASGRSQRSSGWAERLPPHLKRVLARSGTPTKRWRAW